MDELQKLLQEIEGEVPRERVLAASDHKQGDTFKILPNAMVSSRKQFDTGSIGSTNTLSRRHRTKKLDPADCQN